VTTYLQDTVGTVDTDNVDGTGTRGPRVPHQRPPAERRERRAAATSGMTIVAHVVAVAAAAAIVPITLGHLGADRYGVWMTMLSLLTLLSLSDAGVGSAIVSRLAAADATKDDEAAAADVTAACAVAGAVAGVVGALLVIGLAAAPIGTLFNVDAGIASEVRSAAVLLLLLTAARIPLDIARNIRSGYQEGYVNGALDIAAASSKVVCVAVAVALGGGLVAIVLAVSAPSLLASSLNWALLVRKRPYARPRRSHLSGERTRSVLRGGALFLVLQVAIVVGYSSDNFVGAQVLGPAAVTQYAVPSQLALSVIALVALLVVPLWPAYADAAARGDRAWVRATFRRSLGVAAGASGLGAIGLICIGRPLVSWWTGGEVVPEWALLVGFAAWVVLSSLGTTVGVLLNAMHVVKEQVICALAMAVVNIVLSVVLANSMGVSGLIWGTVISYLACVCVPFAMIVPRVVRRQG
jgi:O-antigen/teichoic acid export membrane protein